MPIKPIALALREVKRAVFQIVLFNSLVDVLVAFLLLMLGAMLLNLPGWYALVAVLVYSVVHIRGNLNDVNFSSIEKKVPALNEELITAADNYKEQNEVVESLCQDVLRKMKDVKTSSFLNLGKLTRELAVAAAVSIIIIGSAAFNVKFLDVGEIAKELRDIKPHEYDINRELLEFEESQNLSEILGDKSVTELGQQQLDLQINPLKSDVEIGTVNEPENRQFREVPPPEISATADASFEEQIPKQYQRIVKTYFKEITKS